MKGIADLDPFANDPLAQRLQQLQIPAPASVAHVASWPSHSLHRPWWRRRRVRRGEQALLAAALAASVPLLIFGVFHVGGSVMTTVQVPGYTLEVAAATPTAPHMNRDEATAVALAWLSQHPMSSDSKYGQRGAFAGFSVNTVTFEARVLKVWHQCGAHWFFDTAEDLWVVDLNAPAQLGWAYVQASVLINDNTRQVQYTDALMGRTSHQGCS